MHHYGTMWLLPGGTFSQMIDQNYFKKEQCGRFISKRPKDLQFLVHFTGEFWHRRLWRILWGKGTFVSLPHGLIWTCSSLVAGISPCWSMQMDEAKKWCQDSAWSTTANLICFPLCTCHCPILPILSLFCPTFAHSASSLLASNCLQGHSCSSMSP